MRDKKGRPVEIPIMGDVDFTVLVEQTEKSVTLTYPTSSEVHPLQLLATLDMLSSINPRRLNHIIASLLTNHVARVAPMETCDWNELCKVQVWARAVSNASCL